MKQYTRRMRAFFVVLLFPFALCAQAHLWGTTGKVAFVHHLSEIKYENWNSVFDTLINDAIYDTLAEYTVQGCYPYQGIYYRYDVRSAATETPSIESMQENGVRAVVLRLPSCTLIYSFSAIARAGFYQKHTAAYRVMEYAFSERRDALQAGIERRYFSK